jgi:Mn-dependent DtxR family transcriptional regulator
VLAITGITNKSLRALMTGLLCGTDYTMSRATYDLARLARNGLITRVPGKNLYRLTGDGLRFAIFYTKLHDRLLRPLFAADQPLAPRSLRKAFHDIDIHVTDTLDHARLLPKPA